MLIYNLERIYKARGIENPYAFFRSNGFSESFSAKLKRGKATGMKLSTLERVCEMLHCTPHDLLEWKPDKNSRISKDHPLQILHSKNKPPDISGLLHTVPLEKIKEIDELLKKK